MTDAPSPDPIPDAFRVLNEIGIVQQLAAARFAAVLPHGMSVAQFAVLNHFARLGGERSVVALARAFQVTKPTMGELVQKLAAKGFLAVRPDPHDKRSKRVGLTAAGRAARDEAIAALGPDIAALERALGREFFAGLLGPLARLRAWLDENRHGTGREEEA